ncbi:SpoIIE family protein phosphatase, partial [Streptomyces sp. NPDC057939]|uniref:SpoIIE family protein phosphatase n=1 Tax=Streptomyces sp. NPDC057939 TaxID=3346284 RepID=UPI0036E7F7C7
MITRGRTPLAGRAGVTAGAGVAESWEPTSPGSLPASLATCAAFLLLAAGCALHVRRGLLSRLRRSRETAGAAQRVLLRPLPSRVDGLAPAAAQRSAGRGAAVGGDLYGAVPTPYGVRVVIGDVRGHGPPALGAAAAVLGSFREAAYEEPAPGGLLRRMERAPGPPVRDRARSDPSAPSASCPAEPDPPAAEEFVTAPLLRIAPGGTVAALDCGRPWPLRIRPATVNAEPEPCGAFHPALCGGRDTRPRHRAGTAQGPPRRASVGPLVGGGPLPPLGVVPLPRDLGPQSCGVLRPGGTLVRHTVGAEDARDGRGRSFPLRRVLAQAAAQAQAQAQAPAPAPTPAPARPAAG